MASLEPSSSSQHFAARTQDQTSVEMRACPSADLRCCFEQYPSLSPQHGQHTLPIGIEFCFVNLEIRQRLQLPGTNRTGDFASTRQPWHRIRCAALLQPSD